MMTFDETIGVTAWEDLPLSHSYDFDRMAATAIWMLCLPPTTWSDIHTACEAKANEGLVMAPNGIGFTNAEWANMYYMIRGEWRRDELLVAGPDEVIGTGAAAETTHNEGSIMRLMSATWPRMAIAESSRLAPLATR